MTNARFTFFYCDVSITRIRICNYKDKKKYYMCIATHDCLSIF